MANNSKNNFRNNFILLTFISNTFLVLTPWYLLTFIGGADVFHSSNNFLLDISNIFISPLIWGMGMSGIAIILTSLVRKKWWIAIPVTIILFGIPLLALAVTWLGTLIASIFYQPTEKDLRRTKIFLNLDTGVTYEKKFEDEIEKLKRTKKMLDENLITQEDYDQQKRNLLLEIEQNETEPEKYQKVISLFSSTQIVVSAILGGFLGGALLIILNYKRLGNSADAKRSFIVTFYVMFIALVVSITLTGFISPYQNRFIFLLSFIYPAAIYLWHKETQKSEVDSLVSSKSAKIASWFPVIILGIASFIATMAIAALLVAILVSKGIYPQWYIAK
jgi:hypothetical protein